MAKGRSAIAWLMIGLMLLCLVVMTLICVLNLSIPAQSRVFFPTPILWIFLGMAAWMWRSLSWTMIKFIRCQSHRES